MPIPLINLGLQTSQNCRWSHIFKTEKFYYNALRNRTSLYDQTEYEKRDMSHLRPCLNTQTEFTKERRTPPILRLTYTRKFQFIFDWLSYIRRLINMKKIKRGVFDKFLYTGVTTFSVPIGKDKDIKQSVAIFIFLHHYLVVFVYFIWLKS